ncbi:DNA-binding transcriptional MerR regulator [Thermocatellispora tengchongensis]|uniref:DNA-binding transcriptional MerR regulator n=1 Tax=Thermocatellispora tengchongensis TaxID=1073253 RepID=A0A840PE73_9ACTN|nr:MerR family transcriptional regulator [Thermocatellispora tengchongensis]MBB5137046.1 DNA-binding transcriptional MerR regulator [Thermocatellispora tengchongensis]
MSLSVGEVAKLAGVSVRTLHHYDEIGLVRPGGRTRAGYRRYGDEDVERLQQVLFYRELGFPLEEISAILADPSAGTVTHLRRQRELLSMRIRRLEAMVAAVDTALEAHTMDIKLTPRERLEVFGEFRPEDHAAEAERRWGGSAAWQESQRRMGSMTGQDWVRFKDEGALVVDGFLKALADGEPAGGERAMELAEQHRAHITRWCYECTYDIHRGLGDLYVSDPRFTAAYDSQAPGLAAYIREAIHANAERAEARG